MQPSASGPVPFSETGLPPTALLIALFFIAMACWIDHSLDEGDTVDKGRRGQILHISCSRANRV